MARPSKPKAQRVSSYIARLLPANFGQQRSLILQFQHFFDSLPGDAVYQLVRVLNVTDQYLHVALPNSALSAYLRLHGEQILRQVKKSFGLTLQLKISTRPDLVTPSTVQSAKPELPEVSADSCKQIRSSAGAIEDEALSDALQSLSETLSKKGRQQK